MKERHLSQPGQPGFSDPAGSETDRDAHFAGDRDNLWELLAHDAQVYPTGKAIKKSEWFAARTTALALQTPQQANQGSAILHGLFSRFFRDARWWMPVSLAGVAAALLIIPHGALHKNTLAPSSALASEAEFEQHIELITSSDLIASSDYSQ